MQEPGDDDDNNEEDEEGVEEEGLPSSSEDFSARETYAYS